MNQSDLKQGVIFSWESDKNMMQVWYSTNLLKSTGKPFVCEFNNKVGTFKKFRGLEKKVAKLIQKHDLKES